MTERRRVALRGVSRRETTVCRCSCPLMAVGERSRLAELEAGCEKGGTVGPMIGESGGEAAWPERLW